MLKSQKHVFWQALLVTVLIFSIGIILGVILENLRTSKIDTLAELSQIDILDIRLQSEIYSTENFNCKAAINENINFAEKIFEEAKILDRYERASRLTEDIRIQHKKYDILRAMLLINSIKIRETCNNTYNEIVYFYKYNDNNLDTKAKQNVFSKLLIQIKEEKGDAVLLIPIAADNEISSINLILDGYGISKDQLPMILINGEIKITEIQTSKDILKHLENQDNIIRL